MLNHLESTVFPKVIARVKRILQVTAPLTSPFTFPSWRCGSIPVTSASSTIQDSDLHLVVALRAVPNSYAFACLGEQSRGRPIAGAIVIAAAQAATAAHQQAGVEATILHELLHVLGFSSNTWEPDNFPGYTHFRDASDQRISRDVAMVPVLNTARVGGAGGSFARTPDATSTFGGTATKSTQYGIATPLVLAAARKHFNCPTLAAMPVENDGGAGSVGSHWETQVVLDEMMAPSSISGDHPRLSAMTVAVLLETRWYTGVAGWEDEVEHAVPYGRWAGCPHATMSVCSANPNLGWCARDIEMDQPTAVAAGLSQGQTIAVPPTAAAEACSWDGMQKGGCLDGSLYEWSRCGWRIGYANRFCTSPSTPVSVTGEAMGPSSRCLGGRLGRVGSTVVSNGFCFVHRCLSNGRFLQFEIPSGSGVWHSCPADGSNGPLVLQHVAAGMRPESALSCPAAVAICRQPPEESDATTLVLEAAAASPTDELTGTQRGALSKAVANAVRESQRPAVAAAHVAVAVLSSTHNVTAQRTAYEVSAKYINVQHPMAAPVMVADLLALSAAELSQLVADAQGAVAPAARLVVVWKDLPPTATTVPTPIPVRPPVPNPSPSDQQPSPKAPPQQSSPIPAPEPLPLRPVAPSVLPPEAPYPFLPPPLPPVAPTPSTGSATVTAIRLLFESRVCTPCVVSAGTMVALVCEAAAALNPRVLCGGVAACSPCADTKGQAVMTVTVALRGAKQQADSQTPTPIPQSADLGTRGRDAETAAADDDNETLVAVAATLAQRVASGAVVSDFVAGGTATSSTTSATAPLPPASVPSPSSPLAPLVLPPSGPHPSAPSPAPQLVPDVVVCADPDGSGCGAADDGRNQLLIVIIVVVVVVVVVALLILVLFLCCRQSAKVAPAPPAQKAPPVLMPQPPPRSHASAVAYPQSHPPPQQYPPPAPQRLVSTQPPPPQRGQQPLPPGYVLSKVHRGSSGI